MNLNFKSSKNKMTINGKDYVGGNLVINGDKIIVDGVVQDDLEGNIKIVVYVHGDIDKFSSGSGEVVVYGNVDTVSTASGDVTCDNVSGNVKTMSGDVHCLDVNGNISTMSGDIYHK